MSPTTTALPEQLDILEALGVTDEIDDKRVDGHRMLTTKGKGWRAKWTGSRWGWVFQRQTAPFGWETWEPDLPFGVELVETEADARDYLTRCVAVHGDDPQWLVQRNRRRRAA
ncbi:hypothetical protein [Phycicoccus sp.]|uniref:hypothetical protein n=1 Tax=Phycicoccus sp. TaxID=1902410 RepID=UPI002C34417F|nr:hypothetical protein [Phycicoccus sp.]HMM95377.1 hypothetical protein [Phycicoccus sp.]